MKSESQIQQDVLHELQWDTRVEETDVGVEVDGAVVTLSGTVNDYIKKMAAQRLRIASRARSTSSTTSRCTWLGYLGAPIRRSPRRYGTPWIGTWPSRTPRSARPWQTAG